MGAQYNPPGGSSNPGLPVWTFGTASIANPPAVGGFVTDNTAQGSTGVIILSMTAKDGSGDWAALFYNGNLGTTARLQFADSAGNISVFYSASFNNDGAGNLQLNVGLQIGNGKNWAGGYQVSILPVVPAIPTLALVLQASAITPQADGTVTPVTSITTQGGMPTNIS